MLIKKTLIAAVLAASALSATAVTPSTTVRVIAFNDFHGTLESPGTFGVQPGGSGTTTTNRAAGGVDFLAGWVKQLKSGFPNNAVVSAGDLIGASPLVSAFFHDEGTIETMNRLGLEFNAVGNHEFDEGKTELQRMQNGGCHPGDVNSCKGANLGTPAFPTTATPVPFEGAKFKFLSANVINDATGKPLFAPYAVKTFANNVRVAFIGMTLKSTPTIVTPSGVAGLTFNDEAATVNALIPVLKAKGVKSIVVLIHQGGAQGGAAPNFISDCSGALQNDVTSPIRAIVRQLDNAVDAVVSGHSHTGYLCQLPNKVGRNIPVTQASAFGRVLTTIDLNINNTTGDVIGATMANTTVDRTAFTPTGAAVQTLVNGDTGNIKAVRGIVAGYSALVSPLANQVIGTITAAMPNSANTAGEMLAGDVIADAQLAATQGPLQQAVVAFQNAGGVRNPGFNVSGAVYPYDLTYQNAFTVQPFGNSMVTLTINGQQLKDVLEQQFVGGGCLLPSGVANNQVSFDKVMQISSSLKFEWSASAPACSKVKNVFLNGVQLVQNGTVLNPVATYRVTVNNFMATGGDNFTVFTLGSNFVGGAQDIDALIAYMAAFKAPNAPYDGNPATNTSLLTRVTRLP